VRQEEIPLPYSFHSSQNHFLLFRLKFMLRLRPGITSLRILSSLASPYKIANVNLNSSVGKHTLDPENLFVKGKNGPFEIFFYLKGLGVIDKD